MAKSKSSGWDLRQLQIHLENDGFQDLYFLVGEESFLMTEALNAFKQRFESSGAVLDFNFDQLYAGETAGALAVEKIETLPMMATKRMVIVREAHQWKEKDWTQLQSVLKNPADSCVVVISADKIDRRKKWVKSVSSKAHWVQLKAPYDNQVPQWIHYIAQRNDMDLSQEQVHKIHHLVGARLDDIRNEILKLKQYIGDKRQPSSEDIGEVIRHSRLHNVFELTDAFGDLDKKRALQAFESLVSQGQSEIGVVQMLARHLRLLRKTKYLLQKSTSQDVLAKELGVHKFFVSKYMHQAKSWKLQKIDQCTTQLYKVDGILKSSPLQNKLFIENIIFQL